jgi:hypothetical protein
MSPSIPLNTAINAKGMDSITKILSFTVTSKFFMNPPSILPTINEPDNCQELLSIDSRMCPHSANTLSLGIPFDSRNEYDIVKYNFVTIP